MTSIALDASTNSNTTVSDKWADTITQGISAKVESDRNIYDGYVYEGVFFYKQNDTVKAVKVQNIKSKIVFTKLNHQRESYNGLCFSDYAFQYITEMGDPVAATQYVFPQQFVELVQQKISQIIPEGTDVSEFKFFGEWGKNLPNLMTWSFENAKSKDPQGSNNLHNMSIVNKVLAAVNSNNGGKLLAKVTTQYSSMNKDHQFGGLCIVLQDQSGDRAGDANTYQIGCIVLTHPNKTELFKPFGL